MQRLRSSLVAAGMMLGIAACGGENPVVVQSPETVTFAPSLGVNLAAMTRLPSGVYYKDLSVGAGARADSGKTIDVRYIGWFANGSSFDTNVGGPVFTFLLGNDGVIDGWHLGIPGMHVGGQRQLVIPASKGYGNSSYGQIPGGSVLIFTVELTAVR